MAGEERNRRGERQRDAHRDQRRGKVVGPLHDKARDIWAGEAAEISHRVDESDAAGSRGLGQDAGRYRPERPDA